MLDEAQHSGYRQRHADETPETLTGRECRSKDAEREDGKPSHYGRIGFQLQV